MRITINGFDSFLYKEVFEVTQWKDGAIYKTKSTGKYIHSVDEPKLDKSKYTVAPMSTSLSRQDKINIDLFDV